MLRKIKNYNKEIRDMSEKENWPTFNSIPKWYDAVCQSVGKAVDITTPGQ